MELIDWKKRMEPFGGRKEGGGGNMQILEREGSHCLPVLRILHGNTLPLLSHKRSAKTTYVQWHKFTHVRV